MIDEFHTAGYLQHNHCRQAHLASLGLELDGKSVLELGAGVGDHSTFWLKRGCRVTCVEARTENVERLQEAQPEVKVIQCDLDRPELPVDTYDVVYAYGILYHLKDPAGALRRWAQVCKGLLLLETCVSPESGPAIYLMQEKIENATASFNGTGCRPTRQWILDELRKWFRHVYLPLSQPRHEEFPLDWGHVRGNGLVRAVFVASRTELENPVLTEILPWMQFWHAEAE